MPASHVFRKIAITAGVVIVAVIAILAAVPLFFGDRIAAAAKTQINNAVDARVAWRDIDLSLLRGFPHATLTVDGPSVAGVRAFEHDTLFAAQRLRLVIDLSSLIGSGKPIVVREISIDQPVARLRRLADGTANWNITKPRATATSGPSRPISVTLKELRVDHGIVTLDDRQSNLSASVHGFDESLSGDFAKETFVLSSRTHADSVSATFAGIPYLHRVTLDLDATVDANTRTNHFAFAKDTLRLNKLVLAVGGSITAGTPDLDLDVSFAAPSTAFGEILSLVPAVYAHDFEKLQTSGTMALSGQVRGKYGPHAFPALAIRARVDNGAFRYPDLPLGTKDVSLELAADNPGGHVDSTTINLKRFHAVIGSRPIDATVLVRTPVSDPDATLRLSGSVDLADVARTVKLQNVSALTGVVAANVSTHARVSDVDAKRYDRVAASGTIAMSRITVRSSTIPHPIAVDTAALALTPQSARLTAFEAKIGNSDVRATGSLDNLIGFVLRDEDLRGQATVNSQHFDLDEWKAKDTTTDVIAVPPHIDFALDASAAKVTYGPLTLSNVKGSLEVKNQRVTIKRLTTDMLRGKVAASGYYETLNPEKPLFDMSVGLTTLDIPATFASLAIVQRLAPIAKYAQGHLSGAISLAGPLGKDMSPVLTALAGKGEISTDSLILRGAPVMQKLSTSLSLSQLESPAIGGLHAAIDVADGKLHVKPFTVNAAGLSLTASGSNGIDQSLAYDLALAVPRTLLGPAATSAITKLASKAGQLGAQLPAGDVVQLQAKVTGTVTNPVVSTNFAGMATSMKEAAQTAAKQIAAAATETAKQKVDSVAGVASAAARARADSIIADAERQADSIRAGARTLADTLQRAANVRIDSLVAKATNPIAKLAAQKAADQLRNQTKQQTDRVLQAANARADSLVAQAKQKAAALTKTP